MNTEHNLDYRNSNNLLQAMVIKIKLLMCVIKVASHKLGACKIRTKRKLTNGFRQNIAIFIQR